MFDQPVISLYDFTGNMVLPWAEAGYDCHCYDIKHTRGCTRGPHENITFHRWDAIRSFLVRCAPCILFAFPPCTDLAGSGARWWKDKGTQAYEDAMRLVYIARSIAEGFGCPYGIENPVGRIPTHVPSQGLPMGRWDHIFDPCDYGDPYTKKTCLWTGAGFVMPPKKRVEPVRVCSQGSWVQKLGGKSERTKTLRSATPMGFARAVFEANQ